MKTAGRKITNALSALRDRGVVRTNILVFLLSAAALLLLFALVSLGVRMVYNYTYDGEYYAITTEAFPELLEDDFASLQAGRSELDFVVFDENGECLYATDETMASGYRAEDAMFIGEYDEETYWNVAETVDGDDKKYYVTKYKINYEDDEDYYLGSAILDADYTVLESDILTPGQQITWQQIDIMMESYASGQLYKYSYTNADGAQRLLFYTEYDMEYLYNEQNSQARRASGLLYLLFFVLAVAVVILQAFWTRRVTRRYLKPLDEAITAYGSGQRADIDEKDLAVEFRPVASNFNKLMDRLDAANAEKDRVYEERQRVIADVSHDLRTPLTVIQGYSQAFLEGRVPEDKESQYMGTIHEKSVQSADMINMLFDYTKMEHPDFAPDRQPVDLTEVTLEYLTGKKEELIGQGDALAWTLPEHTVMYDLDVRLLFRLYDNLIGNAAKHNEPGTTVYFALEDRRFDIRITIADDGKGMPEELKKTLFNPFVTGNRARTSGGGTGLGMTIAKRIVDLHGGSIRLVDPPEEGKATEFEIIFHKGDPQWA